MPSSLISTVASVSGADSRGSTSLLTALAGVPDPRDRRGCRYPLAEILGVAVCAVVAGARTFTMIAEWAADAATHRPVTASGRVPTLATIHRICSIIDGAAVDAAVSGWVRAHARPRAVAIDGKEARGAKNAAGQRVFLMAALDHDHGSCSGRKPSA